MLFGLARRTARNSRKYHYFTGLGAEAGTHVPAFRGPFGRAEGGVGIRAAAVVGRRSHVPARNAGRQQPTWQTKGEEERGNSPAATHQPVAVHGPRSPLHSSSRSSAQQLVFRLVRKPARDIYVHAWAKNVLAMTEPFGPGSTPRLAVCAWRIAPMARPFAPSEPELQKRYV